MRTGSTLWREPEAEPADDGGTARADRALGRWVVAAAALALAAVVYVLHGALPVTPFGLPLTGEKTYARTFAPQSWAFFTKDPLTPTVTAVAYVDGAWRDRGPGRLAVPADLMGLNRVRQAEQVIMYDISAQVPPAAWTACDRPPIECLSGLPAGPTVENRSTSTAICGDVGLIEQEVQPWVWRELPAVMPSKVVRVTVTC